MVFSCKSEAHPKKCYFGSVLVGTSTLPVCSLWSAPWSLLPALYLPQFVTKAGCLLWVEGAKTHSQPTPHTSLQRRAWSRLVWSAPKAIVLTHQLVAAGSWPCFSLDVKETIDFQGGKLLPDLPEEVRERKYKENQSKQWYGPQLSRVNSKGERGDSWSGLEYTGPNPKLA